MANLKSVIRLRKFELDERRRAVVDLEKNLDNLDRQINRIHDSLAAEMQNAREDEAARMAFPNFNQRMQKNLVGLNAERSKLLVAIDKAKEELQDAFKELKTIEITERERQARKEAEEKHKENNMLDEIGLEQHRRRKK